MLSAKTEVSTNIDIKRRTKRVPTIEIPPRSSGIAGRDDPAEDEQQQQGEQREGDQLGLGQVGFGLVVHLVEARGEAAHRDVEPARVDQRRDLFGGDAARVLDVGRARCPEIDQRLTVAGDQRARRRGGSRSGLTTRPTYSTLRHPAAEPVDLAAHGGAARSSGPPPGRADDEHDRRVGVVAERVATSVSVARSLSEAVSVKPAALQVLLDVFADRDREDDEGADRGEDELRVLPGQVGDVGVEHAVGGTVPELPK